MHSLRNSPPDCFSQMLTHLEPRVSCTACNSLGSKPPPYHGPMWGSDPTFSVFTNPKILFIPIIIYRRAKYKNGGAVVALRLRRRNRYSYFFSVKLVFLQMFRSIFIKTSLRIKSKYYPFCNVSCMVSYSLKILGNHKKICSLLTIG